MPDLKSEVHEAMNRLRPFVEERIRDWMAKNPHFEPMEGAPLTTGFVAAGVEEVLRDLFPECYWRIAGGYGLEYCTDTPANLGEFLDAELFPGGMVNEAGEWHGHFWVTGGDPDSDDGLIIDLSADQFGHEEVVVTDRDDPRYRENCYLGVDDKIRPSERGWGMMMYAMWKIAERERASGGIAFA